MEQKTNETKSEEYFWYIGANRIPKYAFLDKLGRVEVASQAGRLCKHLAATDRNCTSMPVSRENVAQNTHRQPAYGKYKIMNWLDDKNIKSEHRKFSPEFDRKLKKPL